MRTLELILVLVCAACSIRLAGVGRSMSVQWVHGMQLLLAVVLLAQLVVEGWRAQMFPAYAAALLVMGGAPYLVGVGGQTLFASSMVSIALLAGSIVSCLVLPFVNHPLPHGPFKVGVTTVPVVVSRPPEATEAELKAGPLVRLWYPAAPSVPESQSARLKEFLRQRIAARFHAAPLARAVPDSAVASNTSRFPVVIYFDGWPEDQINNVNLIVELVSHGFAVASAQYPARPPGTSDAADASLRAALARDMVGYSSDAAFRRSVDLNNARARIHARDAISILDALAKLDADGSSRFAHRLDTQHAGTLGFSFGGALAGEASRLDPRIRAVVNMDGRHWGDVLYKGVERPYMLIGEVLPMPTAADLNSPKGYIRYEAMLDQVDFPNQEANMKALGGIHVTIAGTAHLNFTDLALRSPLRRFSDGGSIDARRAQQIIQTFVVEFFSRYLLAAQPPPLTTGWPQFPEVHVETWLPSATH
jgi:dienelactone hydrolase